MRGAGGAPGRAAPRHVRSIPYANIKGFSREAIPVAGHRFEVLAGTIDGMPVVMHPGRVHLYQGYSAERD